MSMLKTGRWNEKETNVLKKHYKQNGAVFVAKLLNRKVKSITERAFRIGIQVNKDVLYNLRSNNNDLSHFINKFTPTTSYMLGFLWADGCVMKSENVIRLGIVNDDFLDIKDIWLSTSELWKYHVYKNGSDLPNTRKQACVRMCHRVLRDFLIENDYLIKSGTSPDKILSKIPEHLQHYWWRGYFDGDGSISFKNGTICIGFTSCYKQDWNFVFKLLKKLDVTYSIRYNNGDFGSLGKNSSIVLRNYPAFKKFCEFIYAGEIFGLKRKYDKFIDCLNYKNEIKNSKSSRFQGVCKIKNRWRMDIHYGDLNITKWFSDEISAAKEYDKNAIKFWGNKAILNFNNE